MIKMLERVKHYRVKFFSGLMCIPFIINARDKPEANAIMTKQVGNSLVLDEFTLPIDEGCVRYDDEKRFCGTR